MATTNEVKCAACGTEVLYRSDFAASHKCPKAGQPSGRECPICKSQTIWRAGRYSTFHACANFLTTGCRGKIGAPRGASAQPKGDGDTEESESTPKPPPPPASKADAPNPFKVGDRVECIEGGSGVVLGQTYTVTMVEGRFVSLEGVEVEYVYASRFKLATPAPAPVPAPVIASSPNSDPLAGALLGALGPALKSMIAAEAQNAAAEAVAKAGGSKLTLQWVDPATGAVKVEIQGGHAALPQIVDLVKCGFNNILLVGPAGSGKTTIAADLAKALQLRFAHLSCTSGMSESKITGRVIPNLQTGASVYNGTPFVDLYENGGVFLFDEIDAADPNVLLTINSAIANGHMEIERPGTPTATRHATTVIIAAANTYGTGADRQYVGRNQLDAAFLDRFCGAVVTVDYDRDLEKAILPDAAVLADLWNIRAKVADLKIRRVVGTRAVVAVAKHLKGGKSRKDALAAVFSTSAGWTKEELTRAGLTA